MDDKTYQRLLVNEIDEVDINDKTFEQHNDDKVWGPLTEPALNDKNFGYKPLKIHVH